MSKVVSRRGTRRGEIELILDKSLKKTLFQATIEISDNDTNHNFMRGLRGHEAQHYEVSFHKFTMAEE